ncbi:MAG: hypothetical protein U9Q66_00480 [Patescibacteria group bacterium]|nr:hypothetical protein [Patescibacteria group bacterium]
MSLIDEEIRVAEDCVKWFASKDIKAYNDKTDVLVCIDNEDETHILVSGSEVTWRAECWNERDEEQKND